MHDLVKLSLLILIALCNGVPVARAADVPQLPDVVGLKLGMTVADTRVQLQRYKPGIWIATRYMTEDSRWWGGFGLAPQFDVGTPSPHPFHDAALQVPVQITAAYIEKAYSEMPAIRVIQDQNTPIDQFSGDFFSLFFTPTDTGGKLYSIVRQRVYFSDAGKELGQYARAKIPLPQISDLANGAIEKYGPPSETEKERGYVDLFWFYDPNGNRLAKDNPDVSRCQSRFAGEDGAIATLPYVPRQHAPLHKLWSVKKGGNLSLRELAAAFGRRDFYKLKYLDTKTDMDDDILKIPRDIVPAMVTTKGLPPQRYRPDTSFQGCGTQLHILINPLAGAAQSSGYASSMTVSLSDQNAQFFDDGVLAYLKAKVAKVTPKVLAPTEKEKY